MSDGCGKTCLPGGGCRCPWTGTGENNDSCGGVPRETWRCIHSNTFGAKVSQVCRGGKWVTFHVSPRNCSACCGNKWALACCQAGTHAGCPGS